MCILPEKETKFNFDDACLKLFEHLKALLILAPIIMALDWSSPFEVMCDASGIALDVGLGKRKEKLFYPIYYASKTLNDAQRNYTVTEQGLLIVVYVFEKFCAYLLGTKVVVHTVNAALKYLMAKKEEKSHLIRWIFPLREFNFKVRDRKGCENQMSDHLSHLKDKHERHGEIKIDDAFSDELVMSIAGKNIPLYANDANYVASDVLHESISYHQRKQFLLFYLFSDFI